MQAIRLSTFRELLAQGHELDCYCRACRRWAHTNLAQLVRRGLGDRAIRHCQPRCRKCGEVGEWQVRPPMPTFHGATWMQ